MPQCAAFFWISLLFKETHWYLFSYDLLLSTWIFKSRQTLETNRCAIKAIDLNALSKGKKHRKLQVEGHIIMFLPEKVIVCPQEIFPKQLNDFYSVLS